MAEPFNQTNWPPKDQNNPPQIGTGEGESPLASYPSFSQKPDIGVRTFSSDVKSTTESGGGAPQPYVPAPAVPIPAPAEEKKSFGEVFSTTQAQPETVSPAPADFSQVSLGGGEPKKSKKGIFVVVLSIIIVVGLAAVGYFFIYPMFFSGEVAEEIAQTQTTIPAVTEPTAPSIPEIPVVTELTGTSTEPATTTEEETTTPSITSHVSLFKTAADVSTNIKLETVQVSSIKSQFEFATAQVPILKEVVFKDNQEGIVGFGDLMTALLPSVFTPEVVQSFETDLTAFTYANENGTWLGFIDKAKSGADLADLKTKISQIETSTNFTNIYLSDPGTPGTWKSGSVQGVSNRYLSFTLKGASLNYGWFNDTLVINTSYTGFQEALKRLK